MYKSLSSIKKEATKRFLLIVRWQVSSKKKGNRIRISVVQAKYSQTRKVIEQKSDTYFRKKSTFNCFI